MLEVYKIKHPTEDKYSSGVQYHRLAWSKRGKAWNSIGSLKNHLNAVWRFDRKAFEWYKDWSIIKIDENGYGNIGKVSDFINME